MCANLVPEVTEQAVFEFIPPRCGREDEFLLLVELVGEEALGIDHRLLADVVLGNLVQMRIGDLDVIAELPVELHFQARDVQPFTLTRLQVRQPFLALGHLLPVPIQVLRPTIPEHVSVPDRARLLVEQGVCDQFAHLFQFEQPVSAFEQQFVTALGEQRMQRGHACQAIGDRLQVAAVGTTIGQPC